MEQGMQFQNIYITSDEEIKEDTKPCWCIDAKDNSINYYQGALPLYNYIGYKKIILTTDQDLIGVQTIDNEFLEWFVKNPSCEEVEIGEAYPLTCCIQKEGKTKMNNGCMERNRCMNYKIIIPKEEPKQEVLEEAKQRAKNYMSLKGALDSQYVDFSNPNADKITSASTTTIKEEAKQGLNLSLLEQKLDEALSNETEESLNTWLKEKKDKQETLEEAAEIDLTNLCYYDKRNPDCSVDDEDIEDHKKSLLKKNKTCSCDNCFYGRTELTNQLIRQAEKSYSEEDMRLAIKKARDISDGKDCFDAEDISGCTEVCTYGWKFNMSEDLIIEQFKKK
jgi:hypothetical protein